MTQDARHRSPDEPTPAAIAARWGIGVAVASLLVWWSGPWWLNSILVFERDAGLEAYVLRPGQLVRWRSEGWGETRIGPHGLPGWAGPRRGAEARVVLWGDSQLEGFGVDDRLKIHRRVRETLEGRDRRVEVLPAGRSGSDARDWLAMMPRFERLGAVDLHGWLVTDLEDLDALAEPAGGERGTNAWERRPAAYRWRPHGSQLRLEFLYHAVRNLTYDPDAARPRRLRWSVGPVGGADGTAAEAAATAGDTTGADDDAERAERIAARIAASDAAADRRLVVFYAPAVPRFTPRRGVVRTDADAERFRRVAQRLESRGVAVVDLRPALVAFYERTGRLPRGFPNGLLGDGHFNATGNRAVASAAAEAIADFLGP